MARPRRSTSEAFFDVFADMPLEDQAAALKILEQVHRLAVRDTAKGKKREQPAPPLLLAEGGEQCPPDSRYEDDDRDEGKTREELQGERCPPRE